MLTAREIMNPEPLHCGPETPIREVTRTLAGAHRSGLLVVDEERRLLGVITESDLLVRQGKLHLPTALAVFDMVIPVGEARFERELARLQALTAGDLMSAPVETVAPDTTLPDVVALMNEKDVHHIPVLDGDTIVGLITKHSVVRALSDRD